MLNLAMHAFNNCLAGIRSCQRGGAGEGTVNHHTSSNEVIKVSMSAAVKSSCRYVTMGGCKCCYMEPVGSHYLIHSLIRDSRLSGISRMTGTKY